MDYKDLWHHLMKILEIAENLNKQMGRYGVSDVYRSVVAEMKRMENKEMGGDAE